MGAIVVHTFIERYTYKPAVIQQSVPVGTTDERKN